VLAESDASIRISIARSYNFSQTSRGFWLVLVLVFIECPPTVLAGVERTKLGGNIGWRNLLPSNSWVSLNIEQLLSPKARILFSVVEGRIAQHVKCKVIDDGCGGVR
jgi:hypothetical protein